MKTKLVRIGKSQGIRIPQSIIEECHLAAAIELTVDAGRLIVSSASNPREGWDEAFRQMSEAGDDGLLDPPILDSSFDLHEWQW